MKKKIFSIMLLSCLCACGKVNSSNITSNNEIAPRFNNISITSTKNKEGSIDIFIESLNKLDNIYCLLVDHEAISPTKEEIKAGKNYNNVNVLYAKTSINLLYETVSNLKPSTYYDIYTVLENNNVYSEIYSTSVYTLSQDEARDKGDGSLDNPYRIETIEDLANVASTSETLSYNYVLMNDLDLSSSYGENLKSWVPLGTQSGSIKAFNGSFNGNGHTISNLYINSKSEQTGLFAQLGVDGVISNLNLENVNVNSTMQRTGALVGYSKGLISNINVVNGKVNGTRKVGGIVGDIYEYGYLYKSYSSLTVSGNADDVGGIVGALDAPSGITSPLEVKNCYSKSIVSGTKYVGGVVGYARGMVVDSCYSMSQVNGTENSGGLIGLVQRRADSLITPTLTNSFALDTITTCTISGGKVIGNVSTSNGEVEINNVYEFNTSLTSPKETNSKSYVKSFFDDNSSWFTSSEEVKEFFMDKNKINIDFVYAYEVKDNALRPTLINASKYDDGGRN